MPEPVSVAQLEAQLRLPAGGSGEDAYLSSLIVSARRLVERQTAQRIVGVDPTINDEGDLALAAQAITMLAAYWYENRDGTGDVPPAVAALIWPLTKAVL